MRIPELKKIAKTLRFLDFPAQVIIETTAYCNLSCIMCAYPLLKRDKGIMDFELYRKIIDEVAAVSHETRIWLAIMGEPLTLGDKLFDYIFYPKSKGIKDIILNTNGTILNDKFLKLFSESGLDEIIIGVDGTSSETYDRIRIGAKYKTVESNIKKLLNYIKTNGLEKPKVVLQFIVMKENEHQEVEFIRKWLKEGAIVKIRWRLGWGEAVKPYGLDFKTERIPCPWLMRTMSIHWNGDVAQCDADYEGIYKAGNVNDLSLYEIWHGELKKRREKHFKGDFNFLPCLKCNDWKCGLSVWYYPDGRVINY